jgi:hypothetical protein
MVNFPPRNETLDFFQALETKYQDDMGRPEQAPLHIDQEGIAVWMQQYLLYRVNGADHRAAVTHVMADIDGVIHPTPGPAPEDPPHGVVGANGHVYQEVDQ